MSADIWKIGQDKNAQSYYNDLKKNPIFRSDVNAVKQLTAICSKMSAAYEEVLKDQNDYLIELENEAVSFEALKEDLGEKIKALYEEIKELEQKEKDGTITEDEKKKLADKQGELKVLMNDSDNKVNNAIAKSKEKGNEKVNEQKSKTSIAKNYGEVTVEKGTPLANVQVKTKSFWRSIFGGTNRSKKEAGDKAVEVGNELLDKVKESTEINNKINKSHKKFNVR